MKIHSRLVLGLATVSLLALAATACSSGSGGGDAGSSGGTAAVKIGLVQGQDFIHAMPARVAEAEGFFTKEGLDASIVDFTSGSDLTKAMAGGSIDVGAATGLDVVSAVAHGVDLQAFWGVYTPSPMALVVKADSSISGFADLAGKKVGISRVGSLTDFLVRAAVTEAGVDRSKVTEVPLGDPASTIAGLANGDIDAFVLPANFGYTVEADGSGKIAQMASDVMGDKDQFAILMAPADYISKNKQTLQKVTKVYADSIAWMKANKDKTVQLAVDKLGMKQPIAEKTYDAFVGNFSGDGTLNLDGLKAYASALPDLGIAKTTPEQSQYVNDTFLK